MNTHPYQYDFFVIGGGSGGLAAAKEAADLGKKVGLADYVIPTPQGTKWGLGGTCVNVGCIPKKLMHYSGLLYENLSLYEHVGFTGINDEMKKQHDWETMIGNVQNYIKKLNFGYKSQLRSRKVVYYNKYGYLKDQHTIELTDAKGAVESITADKILIAVGGRPAYPDVPGAKELCITSDDIFSLKKSPGKTLVVGASYIALECGGFLGALGYDTTVMVRSILLRGFDQDMAERIGQYMAKRHINFIRPCIPESFSKSDSGRILVEYKNTQNNETNKEEYDTVLLAIGRHSYVDKIVNPEIGLKVNRSGKAIVDEAEHTNIDNIFSLGDCAEGRPELTPPAIKAGKLLAHRLFGTKNQLMDYKNIATAVFTPLEYGAVGYSQEDAIKTFGEENIKIFESEFTPLEWNINPDNEETGYLKIIVNLQDNNRVIGFHIVAPNAGEITQGIAVAMKCGLTKEQLDDTVGIHPTVAEEYTQADNKPKDGC